MVEIGTTTWQAFLDEVCLLAEQNHEGYHIYEVAGSYSSMSDTEFEQQEGRLPGRVIAYVFDEPIMHDGEVMARYKFVGDLIAIYPDKKVRRGAPNGNNNAAKGRYPRRILSHAGESFDLVMDHLVKQGKGDSSNSEVLEAMNSAFRQVYGLYSASDGRKD